MDSRAVQAGRSHSGWLRGISQVSLSDWLICRVTNRGTNKTSLFLQPLLFEYTGSWDEKLPLGPVPSSAVSDQPFLSCIRLLKQKLHKKCSYFSARMVPQFDSQPSCANSSVNTRRLMGMRKWERADHTYWWQLKLVLDKSGYVIISLFFFFYLFLIELKYLNYLIFFPFCWKGNQTLWI